MNTAILVLTAVTIFCELFLKSQATTCKALSLKTCEKSLYMTGTCKDEVCQCVSDYTPGPFGCQKRQTKTAVKGDDFSGEVKSGKDFKLKCQPMGVGSNTYKWYRKGNKMDGLHSEAITMQDVTSTATGDYTCQSNIAGILSDQGDAFTVTVNAGALTTKPEVTGMPTKTIDGMTIELKCVGGPIGNDVPVYTWVDSGTPQASKLNTYSATLSNGKLAKRVTCKRDDIVSDPVTYPSIISPDFDDIEITPGSSLNLMKGEDLILYCDMKGGFPNRIKHSTISYAWKKGSTKLTGEETYVFKKTAVSTSDSGLYTCELKHSANAAKSSPAVNVTVKSTLGKDKVKSSSTAFLKKGHFSLTCLYKTVNTLLPVNYTWALGDVTLPGVEDKTLQFNEADTNLAGDYGCAVTGQDGTVTNTAVKVLVQGVADISSDTPQITGADGDLGVGNNYSLQCKGKYYTPGMTFEWFLDTAKQAEVSNTFLYTPKNTDATDIKCKYIFDGSASKQKTKSITATYILKTQLMISDQVVSSSKPVAGSKVKILCDVTKSETAEAVTYKWLVDTVHQPAETSKEFQFTAGAAASPAKTIKCEASFGGSKKSASLTLSPKENAETPTVYIEAAMTLYLDAEANMRCISTSYAQGATFEWMKDGAVIAGVTTVKYTIKKLTKESGGDYSCKITVGGKTSQKATNSKLQLAADEYRCIWADECNLDHMDKTVCDNGKCKCLDGYHIKFGKCSGKSSAHGLVVGPMLIFISLALTQLVY